ncbi:MAG: LCP family protein [Clostridia bacterium]|nr:LCP family protein [Clostridia bacterium]
MTGIRKLSLKLLPRIGAVALAAIMAFGVLFVDYFVLYSPEVNNVTDGVINNIKGESGSPSSGMNDFGFDDEDLGFGGSPTVNGKPVDDDDRETSDKIYNFLIMGHDRVARLTDVIMLINYNIEMQRITIMQIPRDTYIEIPDYDYHKINGLYNYYCDKAARDGHSDPELAGCKMTERFLEKNLAIDIQNTAVMDLDGFGGIVDAIGGVDMNVPMRMYYHDPEQGLHIDLQPGYQHLDGNQAEQFIRYRAGFATGDIGRGNAQKVFIAAFIDKLLSSIKDVSTITAITNDVIKHIKTDIGVADIIFYAKQFVGLGKNTKAVSLSNVWMMTMPGRDTMYNGQSYYVMNKAYVSEITSEYYNKDFIKENGQFIPIKWDFDVNEVFTSDSGTIRDIYLTDKDSGGVYFEKYNAADIEESGVELH